MEILEKIAERRIREAIENGEFDNLPNQGKPLRLHEDSCIPEELRMSYKVLKNAGCIPPELELRKEITSLRSLIDTLDDNKGRLKRVRELNFKLLKRNEMRKKPVTGENVPEYEEKIYSKLL